MNQSLAQHLEPELLSALIDDELDPMEAREVQAHLGSCLHCRQRLDGLRRVASGLRELERAALPTSLDLAIRRQVALDRAAGGLRERLEASSVAPRRLSAPVGLGFALVLALAAIGLMFAQALERRQTVSVVVPAAPAIESSPRDVAGRLFVRHGEAWRESAAAGEPARAVASDSEEGRRILLAHPDLEALLGDAAEVQLLWEGDLVALRTPPPAPAPAP
jgi:anti-sigma factor RsiW